MNLRGIVFWTGFCWVVHILSIWRLDAKPFLGELCSLLVGFDYKATWIYLALHCRNRYQRCLKRIQNTKYKCKSSNKGMYINVILNCYKDSFRKKQMFYIFPAFRYTFSIISASFCSLRLQLRSAQLQSNVVHHNVAINAAEMLGMDIPIWFHMAGIDLIVGVYTIPSMGMLYLPEWLVGFYGKLVGNIPYIDPMGHGTPPPFLCRRVSFFKGAFTGSSRWFSGIW